MTMAYCFYVTLGQDILKICSLYIRNVLSLKLEEERYCQFNDKFYHFQYATLEMFKEAFSDYSMLELRFFINIYLFAMYCENVSHQYYAIIQVSKPHVLPQNCPKEGQINVCLLLFATAFYHAAFFLLKGQLKDITIYFPNDIINEIIQCYQFSHWILTLLPLMLTDITQFIWINGTQSPKSMNPIQKI